MMKILALAAIIATTTAFAPLAPRRVAHRQPVRMVALNGPGDLQRLAEKCAQGNCDVYQREAVVKELLSTKRELKAEIVKVDQVLREMGYMDEEDNFASFVAGGVMRLFGGSSLDPPAARSDGYPIGFSGDVRGHPRDFYSWDWDFRFPSFSKRK